jgi:UDP-N-acetyl-D-galactosamine dehydrogenase
MGKYIARQTIKLLSALKIKNQRTKVAIFWFSFKENIPDFRNTKVIQIIKKLKDWNYKVEVFDNFVSSKDVKKEYGIEVKKINSVKKNSYDAIIIAVAHSHFFKKLNYYDTLFRNKNKKILIDVKNIFLKKDLNKKKYNYFQL